MQATFTRLFPVVLLATACSSEEVTTQPQGGIDTTIAAVDTVVEPEPYTPVAWPFEEAPLDYTTTDILLPKGLTYRVLFQEKSDMVVRADGQSFPAKGYHDMNAFLPIDNRNDLGWLYTSHESRYQNADLGDAGGGTIYKMKKDSNKQWQVDGDFYHIDFSNVGGTIRNCGGKITPHGTILSAEESFPPSNSSINYRGKGIQDTSDYNGRPRYLNMGFMVEVDPEKRQAKHKLLAMGRFMHEDAYCMPDGKTVYLTDDYNPAVFFKFIADEAGDYTQGQLYAYKQSEDGESGSWLTLPRDTASLLDIRNVAIGMGASMFVRHEWLTLVGNRLFITETGDDDYDWAKWINMGGVPANHCAGFLKQGTEYDDVFGRVLVLDLETNKMSVHLEGGAAAGDSTKVFSNPDCCTSIEMYGTTWLILNEDINWYSKGRVDAATAAKKIFFNEIYVLDANIENPTVDDLHRLCMAPRGSESTGGIFSPDGKSYFVNMMHPMRSNPKPFDRSTTVVIEGF